MKPAEVFPPGAFLLEELNERGWTSLETSQKLLIDEGRLEQILSSPTASLSLSECERIGAALGTSAALWANINLAWKRKRS